jgi:hypothetical protein
MRTASRLPRADGADDSLNIEKLRRDASVAEFMEIASVLKLEPAELMTPSGDGNRPERN